MFISSVVRATPLVLFRLPNRRTSTLTLLDSRQCLPAITANEGQPKLSMRLMADWISAMRMTTLMPITPEA